MRPTQCPPPLVLARLEGGDVPIWLETGAAKYYAST